MCVSRHACNLAPSRQFGTFNKKNLNVSGELYRGCSVHVCVCFFYLLICASGQIRLREEKGKSVHILKTLHTADQYSLFVSSLLSYF